MRRIINILTALLVFQICYIIQADAQTRRPAIVSPEIHKDNSITFRFSAPDAKQVELNAQFLEKNLPMTKDENGLWTITTQPAKPDLYPYCFMVDGLSVADPSNVLVFPNERFKNSLVDIQGNSPFIYSVQDVPHGEVTFRYYKSETLKDTRPLVIYTPPGYDPKESKKYPVLYLVHGATDTHETWHKVGRANFIIDNLIAQGKAEPMIIVMPYANPAMTFAGSVNTEFRDARDYTEELVKNVIPYVEKNYLTLITSDKRAIAGFSRGGYQILNAGLGRPDLFAYVCAFAPGVNKERVEESFRDKIYASPDELKAKLKLLWLSCGTEDFLYQGALDLAAKLEEAGIPYEKMYTPGGHTWMNCRIYLHEIAQRIFK